MLKKLKKRMSRFHAFLRVKQPNSVRIIEEMRGELLLFTKVIVVAILVIVVVV